MAIEIIPPGSSAVVTEDHRHYPRREITDQDVQVQNVAAVVDRDRDRRGWEIPYQPKDVEIISAVKDAEANLASLSGTQYGNTVATIKDGTADLERSSGQHYGNLVGFIKDAQSNLERSSGLHYADTVKTVKDAETGLERSNGFRFAETVKTVKDAESGLERSAGTRFGETLSSIRQAEVAVERSGGKVGDLVRQSEVATERSKARLLEEIKETQYKNEKTECETRDLVSAGFKEALLESCEGFDNVKNSLQDVRRELLLNQITGFKDNQIEFKNAQSTAYQIAASTDKTLCENQKEILLQFKDADKTAFVNQAATMMGFKDQMLLSERLAAQASKELAECCCELKEIIRMDGQKTRDLINAQEVDRLRDKAAKAEAQLAAYFARGIPPVVPAI